MLVKWNGQTEISNEGIKRRKQSLDRRDKTAAVHSVTILAGFVNYAFEVSEPIFGIYPTY